jgi:gamma-glutamylcyclotransferase
MPIIYFAYGSNMASQRLLQRLPRAKYTGIARLAQHRLSFRKNDSGRSGKCDIELTGRVDDEVIGVIYEIGLEDKKTLDQIEGLGIGYDEKTVELRTDSGQTLFAVTYFAIDIDDRMVPYHWYKRHVLRGAIEHGLPQDYVDLIESTPSKADADDQRNLRELAIYNI